VKAHTMLLGLRAQYSRSRSAGALEKQPLGLRLSPSQIRLIRKPFPSPKLAHSQCFLVQPDARKTPGIRSGVVPPEYSFAMVSRG